MASYQERRQKYVTLKTRELLQALPPYIFDFFRGIEHTSSANTRLAYAYDIRVYLNFLHESIPTLKNLASISDITLEQLEAITPRDIERYLEYLSYYETSNQGHHAPISPTATKDNLSSGQYHQNGQTGKARKLASIKTLYNYFYKQQRILRNPTSFVDMPKIYEKPIIKLDVDEIAKLLDVIESGAQLTDRQKIYHEFTRKRDLAIVAVLLGTGIRVSECVGINLEDIDFNYNGIKITRKGGNETIIYFSQEVEKILKDYLTERRTKTCKDIDHPLFLSLQNKRISVRSVQLLVKKYSHLVTQLKKITPHKLRSTYGTQLYQETGDIYLVADVLGHKDVNTTKKHYAQMDDARKRYAASIIKLREE